MDGSFPHGLGEIPVRERAFDGAQRAARLTSLVSRVELFERGDRAHHRITAGLESSRCVWFGLGVAGRRLSCGLPFDVSAMLLAQEIVRRELRLPRSEVLLADENAIVAGWPRPRVEATTDRTHRALDALIGALRLPATVIRASELARPDKRAALAQTLEPRRPYAGYQLAQVEAMRARGGVIKLGWSLGRSGFDETACDRDYARRIGGNLSCVYTTAGRRLDPRRPRACPYVCSSPSHRILVDARDSVRAKLAAGDPRARSGYLRLLGKITRAMSSLAGTRPPRDPVDWVEDVLVAARRRGGFA
jgi:hypothetical protein